MKRAVIIGAGPAGLTAAYELLTRTDIVPVVIERNPTYVGGISRTENYNGNYIDIGGHRFYSKSERVMRWWTVILPVQAEGGTTVTYQRSTRALTEGLAFATPQNGTNVLIVRPRKTRIVYHGNFFAYPVELSFDTLRKLGLLKVIKIGITYTWISLFPRKPEKTLEDFFINRFGTELYKTFFKSYTEKVWGVSCKELSAEWGAQRVKGLSITKAVIHALKKIFRVGPLAGKSVETSLIEQFLYPTFGPGLMWERVADRVREKGGEIRMGWEAVGIAHEGDTAKSVTVRGPNGTTEVLSADYIFSTTDIRALANLLTPAPPKEAREVMEKLEYRDFLTVGLLLEKRPVEKDGMPLTDTWMYIHEPGVDVGRVQLFHNWSPAMVADQNNGWVGLEYFCKEGDELWEKSDAVLIAQASSELETIGLRRGINVLGGTVIREKKAYPGYFGAYEHFPVVREYLSSYKNFFPIGRNGMHRYNNQDHSMLAAMTAVDIIVEKNTDMTKLWSINTEQEYGEEKK